MLDLSLFKRPAMVGISVAAFAIAASIFAMFLYLTLYIQDDLGYGPFAAGLRFLPISVVSFFVAPFAGRLRPGPRPLPPGARAAAGGHRLLLARTHADSGWTVLVPGFIVAGIGVGTANPVIASSSVAVVPPQRSGMASGSSNTFRQVGIATGIAGLGAVFLSQIPTATANALATIARRAGRSWPTEAAARAPPSPAVASAKLRPPSRARPVRHALISAYQAGFTSTFNHLMDIAMVIALVGGIGSLALIRQRDFVPSLSPDEVDAESGSPKPSPVIRLRTADRVTSTPNGVRWIASRPRGRSRAPQAVAPRTGLPWPRTAGIALSWHYRRPDSKGSEPTGRVIKNIQVA